MTDKARRYQGKDTFMEARNEAFIEKHERGAHLLKERPLTSRHAGRRRRLVLGGRRAQLPLELGPHKLRQRQRKREKATEKARADREKRLE